MQHEKLIESQAERMPNCTNGPQLLSPATAATKRASFRRSIVSIARPRSYVDLPSRMSMRPTLASIRQRLSGVFSAPDIRRYSHDGTTLHTSTLASALDTATIKSDPYWRPEPFRLDEADEKTLLLVKNLEDFVDVISDDLVVYNTNLPVLQKATKFNMPNHIEIIAPTSSRAVQLTHTNANITKINNEVILELKGLDPIKFYRAKPDCLFAVDCFTARKASNRNLFSNAGRENDLSIEYAWKHTSMVGKGGLKLVDLRDNEVLAYYIPSIGKSFAKIRLQGSGIASQRLVVSTILALKYRSVLSNRETPDIDNSVLTSNSGTSTIPSESETAYEIPILRHDGSPRA